MALTLFIYLNGIFWFCGFHVAGGLQVHKVLACQAMELAFIRGPKKEISGNDVVSATAPMTLLEEQLEPYMGLGGKKFVSLLGMNIFPKSS